MDIPEQSITYMDPALYESAAQGKIDPFQNYQTSLNQLLTPNKNTILHVYLENQRREPKSTDFVNRILEMCPPLLLQANTKGEIPLHFAARYGHANVVQVLIDHAKALPFDAESRPSEALKMLRMTNGEKYTALHVAALNIGSRVVEILTREDPEFSYSANAYGETPLYLVTNKRSNWFDGTKKYREEVIDNILRNCKLVDYSGPNGRTALHAAVMHDDHDTVEKILKKEKRLAKAVDENGWSPLHYAAYFNETHSTTKLLLQFDVSAADIVVSDKKITALHIAALQGNVEVMKAIVSACPTCCELVDNVGRNAVHYLLANGKGHIASAKALTSSKLGQLIDEKDYDGNSPLHLVAAFGKYASFFTSPLQFWGTTESGVNKDGLSVDDILKGNFPEKKMEILESWADIENGPRGRIVVRKMLDDNELFEKETKRNVVPAALIATVTFAAAFTLPGGYKDEQGPDQGSAILSKNAAFKAFLISDAISMVLSLSALFLYLLKDPLTPRNLGHLVASAYCILFALVGMVIAFVTGTYAVLPHSSGLATSTCLIGLSFFVVIYIGIKNMLK